VSTEVDVARIFIIAMAISAGSTLAWYYLFSRYNRKRAVQVVDRLRLAWRGRILSRRWSGTSRLHVGMQLPSALFGSAHVTVRLLPRAFPVQWLLRHWEAQIETITIETDLDRAPSFSLKVHNHRWSGHLARRTVGKNQPWVIHRSGPMVLTTCADWDAEHNPVLSALLVARQSEFTDVALKPQSPHLTATLPVDALTNYSAAMQVFEKLRELAQETRASKN
jgi:hypothetical protein